MRIGINGTCLEGRRKGVGRYLTNILREWKAQGISDEIIIYLRGERQADPFLNKSTFRQVVVGGPFKHRVRPFWEHICLPLKARTDKIDVLFSPSYVVPFVSPFRTVVVQHDLSYEALPDEYRWKEKVRFNLFSRRSAEQANFILTISEFSKKEIVKYYGVSADKIVVTYLDCDPCFRPIDSQQLLNEFRSRFGLAQKFLLFVGTMFERRHVDSLIAALELVLQKTKAQLVLIGTFPPGGNERIKALMQNPAIKDHILHFEFVSDEDLNLFYNAAAMLVYPSIYEGFGLPVLEAMRCGTPVLVSRLASLPEVAGDAGLFVDPWDPVDIADKVCYLLADASVRANMIEKGLSRAESFSWSRCARITLNILRLAGAPN